MDHGIKPYVCVYCFAIVMCPCVNLNSIVLICVTLSLISLPCKKGYLYNSFGTPHGLAERRLRLIIWAFQFSTNSSKSAFNGLITA